MRSLLLVVVSVLAAACSGQNLIVVEQPAGTNKFLVQRTVSDVYAVAPTVQRSWLELCEKKDTTTKTMDKRAASSFTTTEYVNCAPHSQEHQFTNSTGYLAGVLGPVIQAAGVVGGAAILADGIRHSGSRTTNNNSTTGGSSSNANTNTNVNGNSNNAAGGNGGAGGAGGHGGNGIHNPPGCANNNPNGC